MKIGDCCVVKNFSYQLQTGFNRIWIGLKCVQQTHCMFLVVKSKGAVGLNFGDELRKCYILQFPTHGHLWDCPVCLLHSQLPLQISMKSKTKSNVIE